MQLMALVCPTHFNGSAGHDNEFPFSILMDLVNLMLKVLHKVEAKGKKGRIERYVCGALSMMGVRKTMMKQQTS